VTGKTTKGPKRKLTLVAQTVKSRAPRKNREHQKRRGGTKVRKNDSKKKGGGGGGVTNHPKKSRTANLAHRG